jgi:hypothetical protein
VTKKPSRRKDGGGGREKRNFRQRTREEKGRGRNEERDRRITIDTGPGRRKDEGGRRRERDRRITIQMVAKRLNLKRHQSGLNNQWIHMPGDVEGHLGRDGNFYVIGN